jgi:pyrimidine operon attenuation protein/uracil phosphoribosyltransferase
VSKRTVLSALDIDRAIVRISHEIVEANRGLDDLVIVGIPTRGVILAERIAKALSKSYPSVDPTKIVGSLDITAYRDDLAQRATKASGTTSLPIDSVDGKTVVLVDDVLYSGRTVRAALDALSELGRPRAVRLAVLIDRGHRELPIRADFVGKNLPTSASERIYVRLEESDGEAAVVIE